MKNYVVSVNVSFEIQAPNEEIAFGRAENKADLIRQKFASKLSNFDAEVADIDCDED